MSGEKSVSSVEYNKCSNFVNWNEESAEKESTNEKMNELEKELKIKNDYIDLLNEAEKSICNALRRVEMVKVFVRNNMSLLGSIPIETGESDPLSIESEEPTEKIVESFDPNISALTDSEKETNLSCASGFDETNQESSQFGAYLDNIDKSATTEGLTTALIEAGFNTFSLFLKNRITHCFGFVNFDNEKDLNRAVGLNKAILYLGKRLQIRKCGAPRPSKQDRNKQDSKKSQQKAERRLRIQQKKNQKKQLNNKNNHNSYSHHSYSHHSYNHHSYNKSYNLRYSNHRREELNLESSFPRND